MAVSTIRSTVQVESKSQHTADSSIQPFLQDTFDPAEYLNATLSSLSITANTARTNRVVPLTELSTQLQTLLSQLNAQTTRLSNALTQLTDEIIRSGSRLAYEVEVLHGETLGLTDALGNGLKSELELLEQKSDVNKTSTSSTKDVVVENAEPTVALEKEQKTEIHKATAAPEEDFLVRLRTLTAVRDRLDTVIKVFGSAMQWPIAPSELSVTSSILSVSAPSGGDDTRSREEKGQQYAEDLRTEIAALLSTGLDGIDAANARVDELRVLTEVWKGTAEEKARTKMVDSLQQTIDERGKALEKAAEEASRRPGVTAGKNQDFRYAGGAASRTVPELGSGYGFLQNLRNLKPDL